MIHECYKKYNKDNIVFLAALQTGISDRMGTHLDVLPVWRCDESGKHQLDIILYGVYIRGERGEWAPPQGVIRNARGAPKLVWLSEKSDIGNPADWRHEGEPSKWQPLPCVNNEWWDARERLIGCCEQVGELFQRWGKDLSDEERTFLHQVSIDYQLLLPPELFEQCQEMYQDFFEWLTEQL